MSSLRHQRLVRGWQSVHRPLSSRPVISSIVPQPSHDPPCSHRKKLIGPSTNVKGVQCVTCLLLPVGRTHALWVYAA